MSAADKQFAASLTPAGIPAEVWSDTPDVSGHSPDTNTLSWLSEEGLLTRRLHDCCGSQFNMRVLRYQSCSISAGLRREVLLCCGEQACIYAITDVPQITLAQHGWLAELGDEPLGESLQSRSNVSRTQFVYALIDPRHLPATLAADSPAWARRSEFLIGADALSVTEVFLHGLAACGSQR